MQKSCTCAQTAARQGIRAGRSGIWQHAEGRKTAESGSKYATFLHSNQRRKAVDYRRSRNRRRRNREDKQHQSRMHTARMFRPVRIRILIPEGRTGSGREAVGASAPHASFFVRRNLENRTEGFQFNSRMRAAAGPVCSRPGGKKSGAILRGALIHAERIMRLPP